MCSSQVKNTTESITNLGQSSSVWIFHNPGFFDILRGCGDIICAIQIQPAHKKLKASSKNIHLGVGAFRLVNAGHMQLRQSGSQSLYLMDMAETSESIGY